MSDLSAAGHYAAGQRYLAQHQYSEAIQAFGAALAAGHTHPDLHYYTALAFSKLQLWPQAEQAGRMALVLDDTPEHYWHVLGNILLGSGQHEAAHEVFTRLVGLQPRHIPYWLHLAQVEQALQNIPAAFAAYQSALAIAPDSLEILSGLAMLHLAQRDYKTAQQLAEKILSKDPVHDRALNTMGVIHMHQGRGDQAMAMFERAVAAGTGSWQLYSNLLFVAQHLEGMTPARIKELHDDWYQRFGKVYVRPDVKFTNSKDPNRKLRIGLVSGDFRDHPIAYFIYGTCAELEKRDDCTLFYYANQYETHYSFTAKFQALAGDRWRGIWGWDQWRLLEQISADEIDILIDLTGHNDRHRLDVFAARAAPVQVTWAGYIGTTGLPQMDWILGDAAQTPLSDQPYYSEKIYQLPNSFICYLPPPNAPDVDPVPPIIKTGRVHFVSFNKPVKLTDQTIRLWSEVLRRVPNSELLLQYKAFDDPDVQKEFYARFAQHGIAADRITMRGIVLQTELLQQYNQADFALDPMPYNGSTTTLEVLWMGVPLITLPGAIFPARHSETYLRTLGLDEWIAENEQDYVDKIVALANTPDRIQHYRQNLRRMMQASPLCDQAGFALDWMQAMRHMWQAYCAQ